jgi:hypothetical protein
MVSEVVIVILRELFGIFYVLQLSVRGDPVAILFAFKPINFQEFTVNNKVHVTRLHVPFVGARNEDCSSDKSRF